MSEVLEKFVRAADYLSAVQIYLRGNYLLEEPLKPEHIKARLLGHWGTCPGINFTYAHLNRAIIANDLEMMFVLGPGHGFPAVQANLFLEGTLSKYYPKVPRNNEGIAYMAKQFSWPYGFPSHSNPEAPGVILEGGELGYALATSYGAALDNPDLIVACLVGDGEFETGPTAAAWHLNKLLDPTTNGTVLPILHVNGYKISGPTFPGRMSDQELEHLFKGYGYTPIFVDAYTSEDVHKDMMEAVDAAVEGIRFTRHCAREGSLHETPSWPMIVMRTPKGWNSIPYIGDKKVEDNHYSHQVIADGAASNPEELKLLEEWMRSYRFEELFDGKNFDPDIESLIPRSDRRMGDSRHTMGGEAVYKPLKLPNPRDYHTANTCLLNDPNCGEASSMQFIGEYMRDIMRNNEAERNFRLMSPDETYSNKLDPVFEVTNRAFVWPRKEWDKDIAWDGRVLEMLSEHSLQGLMQGYVLTGRHAVFASYEAFVQIVASMADQYAKFLNIARDVEWRGDIPSLNYILTSSGWRQEHNGFSHQNPGFIDGVLQRQGCFTNVYFPADANSALVVFKKMMESKKEINVLVCGKRPLPCWRTQAEAEKDLAEGISIWDFASDNNPHMVFSAVGDYLTKETLAAIELIKEEIPEMNLRFVNITSLSALGMGHSGCRILRHDISHYFTEDKPVLINFHGYPQTMKQVLFDYGVDGNQFDVRGYVEQGSTTTPFDMMVRNRTDRYHLAMEAFSMAAKQNLITSAKASELTKRYQEHLDNHKEYIIKNGADPDEITDWVWKLR
ncbi:phosphoketolase family protein [Candidatus Kaiserbacteria bacterium]|nr:phosphoketolase family protein [Candidatus Kaiserbacteria bacterium]